MNESSVLRIKINGVEYSLDLSELTFGELELLEKETGRSVSELDTASATTLLTLAWLARRRKEPMFTIEEMRMLPFSAVEVVEEPDPTQPVDDGATEAQSAEELGSQS
jgi:hypothetical protein